MAGISYDRVDQPTSAAPAPAASRKGHPSDPIRFPACPPSARPAQPHPDLPSAAGHAGRGLTPIGVCAVEHAGLGGGLSAGVAFGIRHNCRRLGAHDRQRDLQRLDYWLDHPNRFYFTELLAGDCRRQQHQSSFNFGPGHLPAASDRSSTTSTAARSHHSRVHQHGLCQGRDDLRQTARPVGHQQFQVSLTGRKRASSSAVSLSHMRRTAGPIRRPELSSASNEPHGKGSCRRYRRDVSVVQSSECGQHFVGHRRALAAANGNSRQTWSSGPARSISCNRRLLRWRRVFTVAQLHAEHFGGFLAAEALDVAQDEHCAESSSGSPRQSGCSRQTSDRCGLPRRRGAASEPRISRPPDKSSSTATPSPFQLRRRHRPAAVRALRRS